MRPFTFLAILISITSSCYSQTFFYGGYTFGKYVSKEISPENMCTKFNLGWDIAVNEDGCLVTFDPNGTNYSIDKTMDWGNLPHGFQFGTVLSFEDVIGFQLGLDFLNQRSDGKRTNLTTNQEEKFSLKTRYAGLAMNFVFLKNSLFQPYVGFDFGYHTMRFWYDNGALSYDNNRLGYNIKLSGNYVPGDKPLSIGFNIGTFINLVGKEAISLKLVPAYQYRLKGSDDINQVIYPDLVFNHSNFSLSFLLTYNIR